MSATVTAYSQPVKQPVNELKTSYC